MRSDRTRAMRLGVIGIAALLLGPPAKAAVLQWNGATADWNIDANWLPGPDEPAANDDVLINAGDVTITQGGELARSVLVSATLPATLTVQSGDLLTSTGITIGAAGTLNLSGGTIFATGGLDNSAGGIFNHNSGSVVVSAGAFLPDTGTPIDDYIIAGSSGVASSVSLINGASTSIGGQLTVGGLTNPGVLDIDGATVDTGAGLVLTANGTVNFFSGSIHAEGGFENLSGGTFNHDGGSLDVSHGVFRPDTSATSGDYILDGTNLPTVAIGVGGSSTIGRDLYIATDNSAMIWLEAGGTLTNRNTVLGANAGSGGAALATGAGSAWTHTGSLTVGRSGNGSLTLLDQATVSCVTAIIAKQASSDSSVTVNGFNSAWAISGDLTIGQAGQAQFEVRNRGVVTNTNAVMGQAAGSVAIGVVNGLDSRWDSTGTLTIGGAGSGLLVVNGEAEVSSANATLGDLATGAGDLTIAGFGSEWTVTSDVTIANAGQGSLLIQSGGRASNGGQAYIGFNANAVGNATVTGFGAGWINNTRTSVGVAGEGTLSILNGGEMDTPILRVAVNANATGNVTLNGSNTLLDIADELMIGVGGIATFTVEAGATVDTDFGFLAVMPGSSAQATLTGTDSLWNSRTSLYVGGSDLAAGGAASLTVTDNASLEVSDTLRVWNTGALLLDGGEIVAGTLNPDPNRFAFQAGRLSVDSYFGALVQNGGTLEPGHVTNTTLITGNYTFNAGMIHATIGGTQPGINHSEIIVGGAFNIGATTVLDISFANNFSPVVGDRFDLFDFASIVGSFAAVNLPTLFGGLEWDTALLLTTGEIVVFTNLLPGDTDGDTDVDDADLGVVFSNYTGPLGAPGGKTPSDGDSDGDGDVDDADLAVSFSNYTGPLSPADVPEPASAVAFTIATLLFDRRKVQRYA